MPRIVFFHQRLFHPVTCGAHVVTSNHAEYLRRRKLDFRVVVPVLPEEEHLIEPFTSYYDDLDVRIVRLSDHLWTLTERLWWAHESGTFDSLLGSAESIGTCRPIREELAKADIFCTGDIMMAPLLKYVPEHCVTILEAHNLSSRQFSYLAGFPDTSEQMFHREMRLMREFDLVASIAVDEADIIRSERDSGSVFFVPQFIEAGKNEVAAASPLYDLSFLSSDWPPNVQSIREFYFEVFLPYLKHQGVRLAIAGGASRAFGIRDRAVSLVGFLPRVADLYERSRIMICPIKYGAGCNVKVLEAMSFGKPVVATTRAFAGLNVDRAALSVHDDPKAFAEACLELINDPVARNECARGSKKAIEMGHTRHHYDAVMDTLYDRALDLSSKRINRRQRLATDAGHELGETTQSKKIAVVMLSDDPQLASFCNAYPFVNQGTKGEALNTKIFTRHGCLTGLERKALPLFRSIPSEVSPEVHGSHTNGRAAVLSPDRSRYAAIAESMIRWTVTKLLDLADWIERRDRSSASLEFVVARLRSLYGLSLRTARPGIVRPAIVRSHLSSAEKAWKELYEQDFCRMLDEYELGKGDEVFQIGCSYPELLGLVNIIEERSKHNLPHLTIVLDQALFATTPTYHEYFGEFSHSRNCYADALARCSAYWRQGRLRFLAAGQGLKDQYEVLCDCEIEILEDPSTKNHPGV